MGLATPEGLVLLTPLGELVGVRWLFLIVGILGATAGFSGFFSSALLWLDLLNTARKE